MKRELADIGIRIAEMRRAKNMTQEVLAEILEVSSKHISHVERGCASLSLSNLIVVGAALDSSMDYLILGKEQDRFSSKLPESTLSILRTGDEKTIKLLQRYLELFNEIKQS